MSLRKLKIKIKSLAAEQRIIRREETKVLGAGRWANLAAPSVSGAFYREYHSLYQHRRGLSDKLRAAQLAYAYLRGRPYRSIEQNPCWLRPPFSRARPDVGSIAANIKSFGEKNFDADPNLLTEAIEAWLLVGHNSKASP